MRRLLATLYLLAITIVAHAAYPGVMQANTPPKIDNNLEKREKLTPCVKALLNELPLTSGSNLSKAAQGTLTAENQEAEKIFFNVTLKTNIGKKGEPPIYLRFIKVNQIDIRKVLEYAKAGDEIYIEQFSTDPNMRIRCTPSSLIVT
jgi:hypothetical protein